MDQSRPWYREPETFIAIAALVVSVSAVGVALYGAALQRAQSRAELWPRVDFLTYTSVNTASVVVENDGVGPAVVENVAVSVDGKLARNWQTALAALAGSAPDSFATNTVADRTLRAGDKVTFVEFPLASMPRGFWSYIGRVSLTICYRSVFNDRWEVAGSLTSKNRLRSVPSCPEQAANLGF